LNASAELLIGLGAAGAWGVSAYLAALASRQFGGWVTNIGLVAASLVVLVPLLGIGLGGALAIASPIDVAVLAVLGLATMLLNVVLFMLLATGPVAVLYPILSANAAVVTVLAIVVLREQLLPLQAVAIVLVTGGVIGIATGSPPVSDAPGLDLRAGPGRGEGAIARDASRRAIAIGVLVTVTAGIVLFIGAVYAKQLGWYQPVLVERVTQGSVITAGLAVGLPARVHLAGHARGRWLILIAAGALDGVAIALYNLGNEVGSTAITATVASTFAVIPVVLAIVLLGERPRPRQVAGGLTVLAGILTLAIA
jgi:drug/metabolite transporter (DMT)-like permease